MTTVLMPIYRNVHMMRKLANKFAAAPWWLGDTFQHAVAHEDSLSYICT